MSTHPHARTSAPMNSWQWRCDVCGRPIADGHGYIELIDPKTGNYPRWNDRDEREYLRALYAWEDKHTAPSGVTMFTSADFADMPQPRRCDIVAYHRRCDPRPNRDAYWFDVDRARGNEMLDWVAHL